MTTCTFAGHREVFASLDEKLEQAIADILLTDTAFVFILEAWANLMPDAPPQSEQPNAATRSWTYSFALCFHT